MGLIGNYSVLNKSCGRFTNGTATAGAYIASTKANWVGANLNFSKAFAFYRASTIENIVSETQETWSFPTGYNLQEAVIASIRSSKIGMATTNQINGVGSMVATAILAKLSEATLAGAGDITSAQLSSLITVTSTLVGTGSVTAGLSILTNMATALAGSGSMTSNLSALVPLAATFAGVGTISNTSDLKGVGSMSATVQIGGTGYLSQIDIQNLANAVWDVLIANHLSAGSAGEFLNGAGGGSSPSAIASAVWDELLATHNISGSAGEYLTGAGGGSSPSVIADAVRTELSVELGRIDTSISSRLAASGYTAPPSVVAIADAVWDELLAGHVTSGSAGEKLGFAALPADIAAAVRTELATELSRIDAAITTRLASGSYTSPPSAATIATQVRTELSTELARVDAAISTRSTPTNITDAQTALTTEINANETKIDTLQTSVSAVDTKLGTPSGVSVSADIATKASQTSVNSIPTNPLLTNDGRLNNLDATVSSRLATSGYTAPANSDITAIKAKTDNLPVDPADNSDILAAISAIPSPPSASTIATAVRSELAIELARIDAAITTRLATAGYTAPPNVAAIATQVRTELTTELGRIDAAISSRLATAGYTSAPTVNQIADQVWDELLSGHVVSGSAGEALSTASAGGASPSTVASAVRSELATELGRIDATITSRLASAGYTAPPSAVAVAGQVRVELGTELGRIDSVISTRSSQTSVDDLPVLTEIEASTAIAKVSNLSSLQTAVVTEINANETKIDSLQSSVNSIPTNPLLTNDARLDRIDVNVSSRSTPAQVNTEVSNVLNAYDPPTKAELDSAIAGIPAINYTTMANAVWAATTRSLNTDVTLGASEINEIATAIEAAIINEGDGQLVIDAIVQAIGNINVPAAVIASAVRTELTTELAKIDVNISSRSSQDSVYGLY